MDRAGADPWRESKGTERFLLLLGMFIVQELGWEQEGQKKKLHLFELKTNKFNIRGLRDPGLCSALPQSAAGRVENVLGDTLEKKQRRNWAWNEPG